ncbi:MAG: septum formation protein Maf [Clostridia bacterium]|nr:septum formation protein Maf [Clostridia bacterium]
MKIILASQSPRRKQLMDSLKIPYEIFVSNVEEIIQPDLSIEEQVKRLSHIKAEAVYNEIKNSYEDKIIIAADTIVFKNGKIYGKPKTEAEAIQNFKEFSDSEAEVITGLSIIVEQNGKIKEYQELDRVKIKFMKMDEQDIKLCLKKEKVYDKAGGFYITGFTGLFIKYIEGTVMSVLGLPLNKVYEILKQYKVFEEKIT